MMLSVTGNLSALLAGQQEIKHLAQKAFTSYIRSMQLMKDKEVFDVSKLSLEAFANSLGLVDAPSLAGAENLDHESNPLRKKKNMTPLERLKEKIQQKKLAKKTAADAAAVDGAEAKADDAPGNNDDNDDAELQQDKAKKPGKWERRQRRIARAAGANRAAVSTADAGDEEVLLQPVETEREVQEAPKTRKKVLKLRRNGTAVGNAGKHTFFSEDGGKHASELGSVAEDLGGTEAKDLVGLTDEATDTGESRKNFLKRVAQNLEERRSEDLAADRDRIQQLHKRQRRCAKDDSDADDVGVTLGGASSASSRSHSPEASPSPAPKRKLIKKRRKAAQEPSESAGVTSSDPTARSEATETMVGGDELGALEREALRRLGGGALFA